jgi:sugar phosphate isomerase/epimerase
VIIGSMRGNIDRPARRNVIVERLADALQEITAYAADKRCSVVLEAINRYENNYLNTAAETAAFVERIGSPKLGVLLDTFHMNIEESNNHAAIRAAGARLKHFHIGENTRWYPGHGQIDFRAILQTLRDIGYVGWISMEYLPQPNEIEAARQGARFAGWARKAFA